MNTAINEYFSLNKHKIINRKNLYIFYINSIIDDRVNN